MQNVIALVNDLNSKMQKSISQLLFFCRQGSSIGLFLHGCALWHWVDN